MEKDYEFDRPYFLLQNGKKTLIFVSYILQYFKYNQHFVKVFGLNTSEGRRLSASCKNARSADEQLVVDYLETIF